MSKVISSRQLAAAIALPVLLSYASSAMAQSTEKECLGNTETFDRKVIQAGVKYRLSYQIVGSSAAVRIAGREIAAVVDRGASWKGPWLKLITEKEYFSFLPEDGGTIKLQLESNTWFSGNC